MGRYISGSGSGSGSNSGTYYNNELVMLRLGLAKNKREFKTVGSDSWTLDHNAMVRIRVWGGGGSGGSGNQAKFTANGSGGGAGGFAEVIMNLTAGTYAIVVGAGGAGVTGNTMGNAGGTSSFSTYISATGGKGGGVTQGDMDSALQNGIGGEGIISPGTSVLYSKVLRGGSGGRMNYAYNTMNVCAPSNGAGDSAGSRGFSPIGGGGGGGYDEEVCYGTIIKDTLPSATDRLGGGGSGYGAGGGGTNSFGAYSIDGNQGIVVVEWN